MADPLTIARKAIEQRTEQLLAELREFYRTVKREGMLAEMADIEQRGKDLKQWLDQFREGGTKYDVTDHADTLAAIGVYRKQLRDVGWTDKQFDTLMSNRFGGKTSTQQLTEYQLVDFKRQLEELVQYQEKKTAAEEQVAVDETAADETTAEEQVAADETTAA